MTQLDLGWLVIIAAFALGVVGLWLGFEAIWSMEAHDDDLR